MYLDFEDYRPEPPQGMSPISFREGVLLSLIAHLVLLLAIVLLPKRFLERRTDVVPVSLNQEPLKFVDVMPLHDKSLQSILRQTQSDMDRQSATRERAPKPENPMPFSRGNTPEMVEGGPKAPPPQPTPAPQTPTPPTPDTSSAMSDMASKMAVTPAPSVSQPSGRSLGDSLHNLQQYLRTENYDNLQGGNAQQSADIQFDSMGVDFGPWLRRFKAQVERNWILPTAAMAYRGEVVIQFNVLRNGTIIDLNVVQPAGYPSLTSSAVNALKLSNPTAVLPPEYPADHVFFTVTFHYEVYRGGP